MAWYASRSPLTILALYLPAQASQASSTTLGPSRRARSGAAGARPPVSTKQLGFTAVIPQQLAMVRHRPGHTARRPRRRRRTSERVGQHLGAVVRWRPVHVQQQLAVGPIGDL